VLAVENAGDVAAGGRISPVEAAAAAGAAKPPTFDWGGVIAAAAVSLLGKVSPPCGIAGSAEVPVDAGFAKFVSGTWKPLLAVAEVEGVSSVKSDIAKAVPDSPTLGVNALLPNV
jgi:hypothetical protein